MSVYATTAIVTSGEGGGGGAPVCTWTQLKRGDLPGLGGGNPGPALTPEEAAEDATSEVGGITYLVYTVKCPSGTTFRLVDPNVTAADLFDLIRNTVAEIVPAPRLDMNPSPEVGGVVNLGLWLAVEAQTVDPVHAEAGPTAWITATPILTNVVFDMGNGDEVPCEGLGVPYPEGSDTADQGPCGYTYREKLPDDAPYTITVTAEWTIPYTSSDGPGALNSVTVRSSSSYDVDEIQTVGSS